jgi:hypothetical protein
VKSFTIKLQGFLKLNAQKLSLRAIALAIYKTMKQRLIGLFDSQNFARKCFNPTNQLILN